MTDIRKIVTTVEEIRTEADRPVDPPVRRVATAAVLRNPFAGRYVEDLGELVAASVGLSATLSAIAVAALEGRPVHSYGKGGIVGAKGELEHVAAMLHPEFGAPLREASGGGRRSSRRRRSAEARARRSTSRSTTRTPRSCGAISTRSRSASSTPPPTMSSSSPWR